MDQPRNPRYVTELAAIHFDGMDGLLQVFAQVLGIQKTTPIRSVQFGSSSLRIWIP